MKATEWCGKCQKQVEQVIVSGPCETIWKCKECGVTLDTEFFDDDDYEHESSQEPTAYWDDGSIL